MAGQSLRAATSSVCACCGEPLAMAAQGMKAWRVSDHFVCNEFCADGISLSVLVGLAQSFIVFAFTVVVMSLA
jgi:hypothetical protein